MPYTEHDFLAGGFGLRFAFLDLVNSQQWDGFGHPTDHLSNPDWVVAFLTWWGWDGVVTWPEPELADLRMLLRRRVETIAAGQHLVAADLAALNAVLEVPLRRTLCEQNDAYQLVLEPLTPGWTWVKAQIVASFVDFLLHYQHQRLKLCANPSCRWAFYDETHGSVRRWCHDRTCGNREKVRRYRRRRLESSNTA